MSATMSFPPKRSGSTVNDASIGAGKLCGGRPTSNHRGKDKRVGQALGRKPHWKRAIVKLADGDRIDQIFEG